MKRDRYEQILIKQQKQIFIDNLPNNNKQIYINQDNFQQQRKQTNQEINFIKDIQNDNKEDMSQTIQFPQYKRNQLNIQVENDIETNQQHSPIAIQLQKVKLLLNLPLKKTEQIIQKFNMITDQRKKYGKSNYFNKKPRVDNEQQKIQKLFKKYSVYQQNKRNIQILTTPKNKYKYQQPKSTQKNYLYSTQQNLTKKIKLFPSDWQLYPGKQGNINNINKSPLRSPASKYLSNKNENKFQSYINNYNPKNTIIQHTKKQITPSQDISIRKYLQTNSTQSQNKTNRSNSLDINNINNTLIQKRIDNYKTNQKTKKQLIASKTIVPEPKVKINFNSMTEQHRKWCKQRIKTIDYQLQRIQTYQLINRYLSTQQICKRLKGYVLGHIDPKKWVLLLVDQVYLILKQRYPKK